MTKLLQISIVFTTKRRRDACDLSATQQRNKKRVNKCATMFDVPPKCPALADKLTGLFNWRHTYKVHEKHKGLPHGLFQKSYSLNLPRNVASSSSELVVATATGTGTTNTQVASSAATTTNNSTNNSYKRSPLAKQISVRRCERKKKKKRGIGWKSRCNEGNGNLTYFKDIWKYPESLLELD